MEEVDREDLFREFLREAERVLDHQVKALEAQDHKTAQTLPLSVATLAPPLRWRPS